ncbi:MAG: ABC transporter substrate-binding protein [Pseudomonadota bacterium]
MSDDQRVGMEHGEVLFDTISSADREFVLSALKKNASRRQVMGWLMAMGATVGSAGAVVTAAQNAIAATPKRGGRIRFAWDLHGPNDTLDPTAYLSSLDYGRGRMTFNNLCRLQEDLTTGPELAEAYEANKDATEWTFQLRKGVEWHDGSKFTADDVVYSMSRHLGKDATSNAKVLVEDVTEWKKIDDHTVKAILRAPNAELPVVLGTFHFKIVKNGTNDFSTATGTGPFVLKEFTPGVRSIHVRNDNYWNEGRPYIDEIEAFAITDGVARVNALVSGDVQAIGNLDPKAISQVKGSPIAEVFAVPSGAYMDIVARYDNSPAGANHLDFITGLKHLQRRERVLKVVQKGIGDIGNDQPVGPAYGASYCKEQEIRSYDPDKAKFHLKKAGITSAELKVAEVGPGLTDICLMLQRECTKVGFNLQIKKVPNDGYWGAIWNQDSFHVSSWNMRPSANIMMTLAYKSDATWNESAWKNERFDQVLHQARGELDPAKRYEMNCELQKLISDEAGTLISTHRAYIDAKAKNLKGFPRVPIAAFGGMEWPEFIWLDS